MTRSSSTRSDRPRSTAAGKAENSPALRSASSAFSLIEMLAAMAVLVLLILLVTQIMNGATRTTGASRQRLDADSEARMVLDRMADDFARMVNRKDVDFLFRKEAGNDAAFFYAEAPAITATTGDPQPVALVGYRINPQFQLERLGKGLTWSGTPPESPVFLTFPAAAPSPAPSPTPLPGSTLGNPGSPFDAILATGSTDANYHVLGENVFRLEFTFLLKPTATAAGTVNAKYSNVPYNDTRHTNLSLTSADGDMINDLGFGLGDVQAVVVTLALIDSRSRRLLGNNPASTLNTVASKFADAANSELGAGPPVLPAQLWQKVLDEGSTSLPVIAAAQIRIYQRTFYLNSGINKL